MTGYRLLIEIPFLGCYKASFFLLTIALLNLGIMIWGMKYKGWFENGDT